MTLDWAKEAPRWFLAWGMLISLAFGSTAGSMMFNVYQTELAEIRLNFGEPSRQRDAELDGRINRLEIRVAAIELQIPHMTAKLDKIDQNVDRLIKRGR